MSSIFDRFLAPPEALQAFGAPAVLGAMLRFEASLARAQARVGLVPEAAAQSIIDTCKLVLFDVDRIAADSGQAGSLAIPLVKSLKDAVARADPAAAEFVHRGSTSQDVIDTAVALCTRDALALIEADVRQAVTALLALSARYAETPQLARTLMQPASVTSFGLKCANWATPLVRSLERLQTTAAQALAVQLGGAVGTLAQMQPSGADVRALMAADLQLRDTGVSWHTQRDEWVALGCELGLLVGSLGKIAKDIALMGQFEVSEVAEPSGAGRGGSSAMPHKRNPVACMVTLAAAQRAPQHVAALLAAMPQEHERGLGNWQAELAEWPQLLMCAHGAARAMASVLPSLSVDASRMLANLNALRGVLPPEAAAEWFDPALAQHAAQLTQNRLVLLHDQLKTMACRPVPPA